LYVYDFQLLCVALASDLLVGHICCAYNPFPFSVWHVYVKARKAEESAMIQAEVEAEAKRMAALKAKLNFEVTLLSSSAITPPFPHSEHQSASYLNGTYPYSDHFALRPTITNICWYYG
jgi:hypothetical protein